MPKRLDLLSGLYLHIPFCKQACSYCDFYFVTRQEFKEPFVSALIQEIESYEGTHYASNTFHTLYIGGGTPSLLAISSLQRIIDAIKRVFTLELREFTVELNPDDVSLSYLRELSELGVNRISMGVQTFAEERLKFMHRAHSRSQAIQALEAMMQSPISNYTIDLIYGQPGQSLEELYEDIEQLMIFNPPHISAYALTVEKNTRLAKQVDLGRVIPAEDDTVAEHMEALEERLFSHGLNRYEVSSFARPGKEALHNQLYWYHGNYLGFGPGAHSFWKPSSRSAVRWSNARDLTKYLEQAQQILEIGLERAEKMDHSALVEEYLWLSMRTASGLDREYLQNVYEYQLTERQETRLEQMVHHKWLRKEGACYRLTSTGFSISDRLGLDLIS